MSRPTVLTPELAAILCERLAVHGSLRRVCRDLDMPTDNRVREWVLDNEDFAKAYARSKSLGIDALVEEGMDLIDEPPPSNQFGGVDTGHVAWAKSRSEYRRWLAERMAPKKYGVRTGVDLTSSDGTMAVDDSLRAARVAAILKAAGERKDLDDISDIA